MQRRLLVGNVRTFVSISLVLGILTVSGQQFIAASSSSTGHPPRRPAIAPALQSAPADQPLVMLDARTRQILATQVALDRAGFSPGVIDGAGGANTDRALAAFQKAKGVAPNIDVTANQGESSSDTVTTYIISAEDAAGPFADRIPADMMEKSKLPTIGYTSVLELLSERFHASPKLLQRLNPQAKFTASETIVVPNVEPFFLPVPKQAPAATDGAAKPAPAAIAGGTRPAGTETVTAAKTEKPVGNVITVTERTKSLVVQNAAGETLFHAPVTTGSENDPLPVGEWKVNGVGNNPTFNYNPDLFWDADPSHAKAKIPAGPNNPVGVVWIDLTKEHYGIHGTPEPSRVGYSESHGCIRLTNWDAMRVAALVGPGTKVILQ